MLARRSLPLLAVLGLLIAGCGGSDENGTSAAVIPPPKPGATKEISGPFAGKLTQAGLAPFRVAVIISPDGTGRVAYTGIDCGGSWRLSGGGSGSRTYEFVETINAGAGGKCKGSGTIHLRQTPGGTIRYRFEGGGVTSTGFLVPASVHAVLGIFRQAGVNVANTARKAGAGPE